MAVQAQYPSNVLFLNRNGQEGLAYSFQQQPAAAAGLFIDQSSSSHHHVPFNQGAGSNPRKRAREIAAASETTQTGIQLSLLQQQQRQQPPQLIDLSQLHNHNVVSTGLRLSFDDHQRKLQQNHHQNVSSPFIPLLSQDVSQLIKQQHIEIDQFLLSQREQLRRTLDEKRLRHYRALVGAAEELIMRRLGEKDAEMEKVARHHAELEARAAQLSLEAQVWQAKAREQEAAAATLQAQLQQAMISCGGVGSAEEGMGRCFRRGRAGGGCRVCLRGS